MNIACPICETSNYKPIYNNYPGYLEGTFYKIYKCLNCDSHFVIPEEDTKNLYEMIYSSVNTYGYNRYYNYAKTVKAKKDPLKFLASSEPTYYPVYQFLKDKTGLNILEIGCGYGYLSYAIKKRGFSVQGLDISSNAIKIAKENFGDFFYNMDINEFANYSTQKFDLIIATELIEHIEKPNDFLSICSSLLTEKGKIILTTPDKDYYKPDSIWQTDSPPVHLNWFGRNGTKFLAEKQNLSVRFCDFSNYYPTNESMLFNYILSRKEKILISSLTKDGKPVVRHRPPFLKWIYLRLPHKEPVLRFLSNFIYNLINGSNYTLGIIFEKKRS